MTQLHSRIAAQLLRSPNLIAIEPAEPASKPITYGRLRVLVQEVRRRMPTGLQAIGILSNQSPEAYLAAAAAFLHGVTFVPLNPKFPIERLRQVASLAQIDLVLTDRMTTSLAPKIGCKAIDLSDILDTPDAASAASGGDMMALPGDTGQGIAYQMFTSGSTGVPKGVPVSSQSLSSYVEGIGTLVDIRPGDRHG